MDRGTRRLFVIVLVVLVLGGAIVTMAFRGATSPPADTQEATGVIVAVDARSLGDVRSFTIRSVDGMMTVFDLERLENGAEFPPGHLVEHQATAEPVRVWYRDVEGVHYAIRIEDAPR